MCFSLCPPRFQLASCGIGRPFDFGKCFDNLTGKLKALAVAAKSTFQSYCFKYHSRYADLGDETVKAPHRVSQFQGRHCLQQLSLGVFSVYRQRMQESHTKTTVIYYASDDYVSRWGSWSNIFHLRNGVSTTYSLNNTAPVQNTPIFTDDVLSDSSILFRKAERRAKVVPVIWP